MLKSRSARVPFSIRRETSVFADRTAVACGFVGKVKSRCDISYNVPDRLPLFRGFSGGKLVERDFGAF